MIETEDMIKNANKAHENGKEVVCFLSQFFQITKYKFKEITDKGTWSRDPAENYEKAATKVFHEICDHVTGFGSDVYEFLEKDDKYYMMTG
ncbi:MAG: hypothetical protein GY870_12485 [archaeon]|nr:hypothetical protein [archaeon]